MEDQVLFVWLGLEVLDFILSFLKGILKDEFMKKANHMEKGEKDKNSIKVRNTLKKRT